MDALTALWAQVVLRVLVNIISHIRFPHRHYSQRMLSLVFMRQ
jgi:hypothetical protein